MSPVFQGGGGGRFEDTRSESLREAATWNVEGRQANHLRFQCSFRILDSLIRFETESS